MKTYAALVVLVLLALTPGTAVAEVGTQPLPAVEILDRSLEALGGFELFARMRESHIDRALHFHPAGGSPPLRTVQKTRFPHTMLMKVHRDEGEDQSIRLHGTTIESAEGSGAFEPADQGTADWFRGFYWREWWVVYARYAWHGLGEVWLESLPPVRVDGRSYHVILVEPRDASEYRLFIDAETWRPARREFRSGDRHTVDVYSEYERFDGVLFPTRIDSFADGQLTEEILYSEVSFSFDRKPLTLRRRMEEILEASRDEKGIPGLVAWVQQGDETLLHEAYGWESVELQLPMRRDSRLPLASVSKVFAGALALRLVEQGRFDLDRPVHHLLARAAERHAELTPRHLLNHSHGLAEVVGDNPGPGLGSSQTRAESWLIEALSTAPAFAPAAGWGYSPTGFLVLQAALEEASGVDYETLASRELFEPLGLTGVVFGGSERVVERRPGMNYYRLDGELLYNYLDYPRVAFASAGLNATARDVATFYRAIIEDRLLSSERREEMWREVILPDGQATSYALGWGSFRTTRDGRWSVGHSGGGSSWTRYFPSHDLLVIVLSNLSGAREDKIVYDLADAVSQARRFEWLIE